MLGSLAFLTSGGDAPGMNAAIRAITRAALASGVSPFVIHGGYNGLIDDNFELFSWKSVANILSTGGTFIKTSRCTEFTEYAYRKRAAYNLIKRNICSLVVIGGDGSLSGAAIFHEEWNMYLGDLLKEGLISDSSACDLKNIKIIGIAASIDNDIYGTDITIGADTALNRIIECVDCISSTASSHSRAFVIEVMGRQCGWLALSAHIAVGADWLFIPEAPPAGDWASDLCMQLKMVKKRPYR